MGKSSNTEVLTDLGISVMSNVKRHIVPFAFILYFFNYMDRVNIGFAKLQMNTSLNISDIEFGTAASAFFISYLLFQIPSNIALQRFGARRWIAFIVMAWGSVTSLLFFAQNVDHVIYGRFLLGVFEAGFFPGMIYYLACWFPAKERGKVTALFMLAIPISSIIASPLSGWIVEHVHTAHYEGWRWLFIIEGIPTVVLGAMTWFILSDNPKDAKWLQDNEKKWLIATLAEDNKSRSDGKDFSIKSILMNGLLWKLAFIYMFIQAASQASNYWLPGQVKGFSANITDTQVGLIMTIPFICAIFTMPLWAAHSDKTGERKWHAALSMLLAAVAFIIIASVQSTFLRYFGLAMFGIGILSFYGPYWALPSALLSPAGLAVSIAVINSGSSLGGFLANKGLGYVSQSYGSYGVFIVEAILCLLSFLLLVTLKIPKNTVVNHK